MYKISIVICYFSEGKELFLCGLFRWKFLFKWRYYWFVDCCKFKERYLIRGEMWLRSLIRWGEIWLRLWSLIWWGGMWMRFRSLIGWGEMWLRLWRLIGWGEMWKRLRSLIWWGEMWLRLWSLIGWDEMLLRLRR